jgi:hypothetical protein
MPRTLEETARRMEGDYSEGGLARPLDKVTGQIPSDTFLWLALGAMSTSASLQVMGKRRKSLFIGQWVPALLLFGLYTKLVKQLGSDSVHRARTS